MGRIKQRNEGGRQGDKTKKNVVYLDQGMGDTAGKLTMSAWADMQQEWSKNTESKELTGILLWDFSAAFDTLY